MPSASLPAAAATASLIAGVASTGVAVAGSLSSAAAQKSNANYQAQVARNNETIAAQNAEYATQAGQEKAQEVGIQEREQQGQVTTALAAGGVDVNSGSAADVEKTQKETGSLATQQTVDNAALQAYGYRTQQANFGAESGLLTGQAGQATTAGDLMAGGGLLSGASGVGLNYAKLVNAGAFNGGSGSGSSFGNISSDASNAATYG